MMRSSSFSKNLSECLKSLGMTQTDFAERTGLTQAAVSMILAGKREPTLSTIIKILGAIPVKFERLLK